MTYRNRALLDLCHEAPCLLLPGQHECLGPPSEPCHSDMIRHGRGEHHKSHDCFAPPGCHNAHLAFTRSNLGKEGYFQAWVEAMERYILWQWVTGKVRLADITQRPKETSMEAPMCRICNNRHWARDPHILPANAPREKRSNRTPTPTEANGREAGLEVSIPASGSSGGGCSPTPNTRRGGRRVLKAEAARSDATRTASTERPNPPTPPAKAENRTKADKVTPGKRKTAPKKKAKKVKNK